MLDFQKLNQELGKGSYVHLMHITLTSQGRFITVYYHFTL